MHHTQQKNSRPIGSCYTFTSTIYAITTTTTAKNQQQQTSNPTPHTDSTAYNKTPLTLLLTLQDYGTNPGAAAPWPSTRSGEGATSTGTSPWTGTAPRSSATRSGRACLLRALNRPRRTSTSSSGWGLTVSDFDVLWCYWFFLVRDVNYVSLFLLCYVNI